MPTSDNLSLRVEGHEEGKPKSGISPAIIRSQLARILGSAVFRSSGRLSRFLEFAVEQTLGGHSAELKEYVVGLEVFHRKQSFDPRMDPIVRVEAGRLRLRIKEYYETEGRRDEVVIELPKGAYIPVFRKADELHTREGVASSAIRGAAQATRIVVMPFADHSPKKDQEWFCDGMTDELVSALTKVPELSVVSDASAFRRKGKTGGMRAIADQLRVGKVVEGSVRKSGDRVRITVQLTDVQENRYLWSETYDREMADIFAIQEDISRSIVDALKIRLAPLETGVNLVRRPTNNLNAYNLYLKGRYYWNTRTEEGLYKGIEAFQRSIAEDSRYALAYCGLADSFTLLGNYGAAPPTEVRPAAKAAAKRAVELDNHLAEAHTTLGHVTATYDWDCVGAEREYQAALRLNPRYATTHHWYAITVLAPLTRWDEAMDEILTAQQLDSISLSISRDVGVVQYYRREYEAVIEQCHGTLSLDTEFYGAHWLLGLAYEQLGRYSEAVKEFQKGYELSGGAPRMLGALGHGYALWGKAQEARDMLAKLMGLARDRYVSPFEMALIHIGLGDRAQSFEWLRRVCEVRSYEMIFLRADPRYDSLRSDKQFLALLEQIAY
jgi:TolB-like protein